MANKPKKKVAPNATLAETKKKKVVYLDEWTNFNTYEKSVLTNLSIERLAVELVEWVRKQVECVKLNQFLEYKGIHRRSWDRWRHEYPVLGEAHDHALMILGNRREVGVMTRKYEPSSTNFMMPRYDHEWAEVLHLRSNLTQKEGDVGGVKIVVLEKYADSPLVPLKVKDDND